MLTYSQMYSLSKEIQERLASSYFLSMKEIEEKKWILSFAANQKEYKLLISLKAPFVRFHLTKKRFFIKETPFTKEVEKFLKESFLKEAKLMGQDRILQLEFNKDSQTIFIIVDYLPRQSNVYLVSEKGDILASAEESRFSQYPFPKGATFTSLEKVPCTSESIETEYEEKEKEELFRNEKEKAKKRILSSLHKMQKRLDQFKLNEEEGKTWEEEKHVAELLQSYFYLLKKGMNQIELEDWQKEGKKILISLDPLIDPAEELKRRFRLSQKLKRKEASSHQLAEKTQKEIKAIELQLKALDEAKDLNDLKAFQKEERKSSSSAGIQKHEKTHPFREFTTEKGLKIYVGKKDSDNEKLTFSFAHGSDIWLHASDMPGSHVILRVKKKEAPDQDSLLDAMQLALHFSKAGKEKSGEVVVTECKNVQRSKKAKTGQVTISHHKKVFVKQDPVRLNRLFSKLLPGQAPL